jgi:hypothetical protein
LSEIVQIIDYSVNLQLLQEQYKKSVKLIGIIEADNDQADDLETALFEIRDLYYLSTATGVQLDVIGNIFGVDREGLNDTDYRKAIEARSSLIGSGEPEFIILILKELYGATYVDYRLGSCITPASYLLDTDATVTTNELEIYSPAGVQPYILFFLIDAQSNFIVDANGNNIIVVSNTT